MTHPVPKELLGVSALAERLDVSFETVRKWKLRGMPTAGTSETGKRDLYDPVECMRWRSENVMVGGQGGKRNGYSEDEIGTAEAYTRAKARSAEATADKTELETQIRLGQAVLRADVERVWIGAVRLVGNCMDEAAGRLATDIMGYVGDPSGEKRIHVEGMIRKELDAAREKMRQAGVVSEVS